MLDVGGKLWTPSRNVSWYIRFLFVVLVCFGVCRSTVLGGTNKATKQIVPNAAKLDEDTGDYHIDRVSFDFAKSLQQARLQKKMSQAQLAQAVNEKPSVINDYEAGRVGSFLYTSTLLFYVLIDQS